MKKQYLECGKIVTTHGILGELKIQPWCDSPDDLLSVKKLYLDAKGENFLTVNKVRSHKNMSIVKIGGIDSVEAAQALRGKVVYAHRNDLPLEEGEFFIADLLGLTVKDADTDEVYGVLCDVTQTGANDVYHVEFADKTVRLVPVIPQVIIETNLDEGYIKIRPLQGLFEDIEDED